MSFIMNLKNNPGSEEEVGRDEAWREFMESEQNLKKNPNREVAEVLAELFMLCSDDGYRPDPD